MVVAMDPVEDAAKSFAETYSTDWTTKTQDVLSRDDVDAVVISAPHYLHAPLTVQAADAGKHVLVEKPIACTLEQADEMIEACRKAEVLLGVLLVSRYSTVTVKAKDLIETGAIGNVIALKFHAAGDKPSTYWAGGYTGRVKTDWRTSREKSGGGILVMNLVHDIDRLRYITGLEAVRVYAEYDTFTTDVEVEDFIAVSLRYDNGAIGNMMASSCARGGKGTGNRIYGTDGQIVFEGKKALEVYTTKDVPYLKANEWTALKLDAVDERQIAIERFAESAFEGRPADIPGEEARRTQEVILAAYRSGELRQPVTLPLV